ncbi:MAG: DUF4397 domain-containing protein [Bacteroidetes bacterium]|nr:DUF4397 domain-containing protein [Bacteroidota bacterium]
MRRALLVSVMLVALFASATSQTAQLQIIHNAADPAAFVVDVYINDVLAVDDLTFRTATAVIDVPANVDNAISLAFRESTSVYDAFATYLVRLPIGRHYAVATGVYQPTDFAPSPDPKAMNIAFTVATFKNRRDTSTSPSTTALSIIHGVTDAPAFDAMVGAQTMTTSLSYGSASEYITVPADASVVNVNTAAGAPIGQFTADLPAYAGRALTLFASGFLDPQANHQGPSFGLWCVLPAGGALVELPRIVSSVADDAAPPFLLAPNPCSTFVRMRSAMPCKRVVIYDLLGQAVLSREVPEGGDEWTVDTTPLAPGTYTVYFGATAQQLRVAR